MIERYTLPEMKAIWELQNKYDTWLKVAKLAVDYRREFKKDVVIDMVCYRRRGHNEADNPSFTQPMMYDIIDNKRSVRKLYTEALVGRGDITLVDAEVALKDFQQQLEKVFVETRNASGRARPERQLDRLSPTQTVSTAVSAEVLTLALPKLSSVIAEP